MSVSIEQVCECILKAKNDVDPDRLKSNVSFKELDIDSLDVMDIFLEVQEIFDVEVPDGDIDALTDVVSVCDYINQHI
jgi:acyl carrier protein